jgi:hypothetical protein
MVAARGLAMVRAVRRHVEPANGLDGRCRWDRHDRSAAADARVKSYAARSDAARDALRRRLYALGETQLRRWFKRMKVYGQAYRDEWGADMIENPARHLVYSDRVVKYWNQRQRVGDVSAQLAMSA